MSFCVKKLRKKVETGLFGIKEPLISRYIGIWYSTGRKRNYK